MAWAAWTGSSLAAARPAGYRAGTDDATILPSAAIATIAVTPCFRGTARVITGNRNSPSRVGRIMPSFAGWPGSPSTVPAGIPRG